jgi:GxxExxY protein
MNTDEHRYREITGGILAAAFAVSNELGVGFLESVYENALFAELTSRGLKARQQHPLTVRYKSVVVGQYFADLIVEDCVMVELKHVKGIDTAHTAQCMNYLRASGLKLCLLINFGKPTIEYKRIINGIL